MVNLPLVTLPLLWSRYGVLAKPLALDCPSLASPLAIAGLNVTITSSEYVTAGTNITIGGEQALDCQGSVVAEVDVCRVVANIGTSYRSSTYFELWLPSGSETSWNGRFLSTGTGGLSGCVEYDNMAYTTSMGFAATGDNSGHNGNTTDGRPFLNNPDVIIDFAYRARHSAVLLGKQLVSQYYGTPASKSYYYGCSTAGRQGLKAAQMFPDDFDGIVAGSPASDFNHLGSWSGHFLTLTGQNASDPRFMTLEQWLRVHAEILNQCDLLDGVADGILEDSSICNFNPETLLCSRAGANDTSCLTTTQAQTVRQVFSPLYGLNGAFIYPRLSPSAEVAAYEDGGFGYLNGNLEGPGTGWYRYAVYNDPTWDPTTLNALDIAYADSLDASHGHVSSYSGDLSGFRRAGGKLIQYHGLSDPIISGEQSMRYYQHVAGTMNASNDDLDEFYRFFRISGMGHCTGGDGAWAFGQDSTARNSTTNVLMEMVNWVENGKAPQRLVGTKWFDDESERGIELQRAHCRYPYRTAYKEGNPNITSSWDCKLIQDWDLCGGPSGRLPKLC